MTLASAKQIRSSAPLAMSGPRFMSTATFVAILGAMVPGFLQGLTTPEPTARAIAAVLVVLALVVSSFGMWRAERSGPVAIRATLAIYGVLLLGSLWFSGGRTFLVAMPFISMLVLFLPLWVAIGGSVMTTLLMTLVVSREVKGEQLFVAAAGFASAFAFVVVFSLIARRERFARHDVERLSQQVAELATARERNRIARELHDSLGHCLTIANVQLEAARAQAGAPNERITRAQQVLREGLAELRHTVTLLREARPLPEALEGLIADTTSTGLAVVLELHGTQRALPSALDLVLFRVAQEALTNARKHAKATRVNVRVSFEDARVLLEVHDDGPALETFTEGHGVSGMRERVTQAGGVFTLERSSGVKVRAEVPTP